MKTEQLFKDVLTGLDRLPTLPGIAQKILEAVQNEETSLQELADILCNDPPLSAEVLKLINSAFYGVRSRITTVHHAVNLLGVTTVKNLALSFSLVKNFPHECSDNFDYPSYWKDSLTGAVATRLLAKQLIPERSEDAFFLGLLNDIGILTLVQCMPDQYSLVLEEKNINQTTFQDAEIRILGFNHMQVGSYLVDLWGLPEIFYVPIRYHHDPTALPCKDDELITLTRILHLASLFVDFINLPDKIMYLGLIEHYLKQYGYSEKIKADSIIEQIGQQTAGVFPIFELQIDSEKGYADMIEAARKELIHLSSDFMGTLMEQQRQIEHLNRQAAHDGLTDLVNYQRFHTILDEELYRSRRYSYPLTLMMLDVDHFKQVNDQYGHIAGDKVLKAIAEVLKDSVRKSDLVARYGGEEFAIILPETPVEGALVLAERLRKKMAAAKVENNGSTISVTASIGISGFDHEADKSNTDLIAKADAALYKAKRSGRNRCCISELEN